MIRLSSHSHSHRQPIESWVYRMGSTVEAMPLQVIEVFFARAAAPDICYVWHDLLLEAPPGGLTGGAEGPGVNGLYLDSGVVEVGVVGGCGGRA